MVFARKYCRKVICRAVRRDIIEIAEKLCKEIKAGIIEGEACPDHIHVLVGDPLYMKYNKVRWDAQELERTDGL